MTGLADLRLWCRSHLLARDVCVAVLTFVVASTLRPPDGSERMFAETGTGSTLLLAVGCLTLVARSRFPVAVWASTLALVAGNILVVGGATPALLAAMVGLYTVSVHQPPRFAVLAAAASAALLAVCVVAGPFPLLHPVTYAVLSWCGLAAALGLAARSRRAVLAAAEERAVRAEQGREEEAQRRVVQERLRIARELHDVLAHHISVINVQSGVARHLMQTDPAAATQSMEHVREASALVLSEMPTILGLLRTDEAQVETSPAPGLSQLEQLVESMRRAGLEVSWRVSGRPLALPPSTDLTAYRLVQEALTNALKHGLGRAELSVAYQEESVVLTVRNPSTPAGAVGEAGHGLIGMQERVSAVGGLLRVGPGDPGTFVVRAELHRRASA